MSSNMHHAVKSQVWQGAAWKVVSCACFAGINGLVRYLQLAVEHPLPAHNLAFYQNLFGTLFLLPWLGQTLRHSFSRRYLGWHALRVVAAASGVCLWYAALRYMPIAHAIALSFTGPIFTVLGARLFLGEKLSSNRLGAILLSFFGAFLILRPDRPLAELTITSWQAILPLVSAIVITISTLCTRQLARKGESAEALATYLLFWMIPISCLFASQEWVWPNSQQWIWLIMMGALSAGAHYSLNRAYRLAEVSFLTPFGFAKFAFGLLIGFLIFQELPTHPTWWLGTLCLFMSLCLLSMKGRYKMFLYSLANRLRSN